MNFINIAGHLGADPEVRFTSSGKKVTTLRVATRSRKGQTEATIWWRVTVWGEEYDKMISYLKKGSAVLVFGEVQKPEIFNDREGKPQISMDITAHHLQFSPFGKGGSGHSSEGGSSEQKIHAAPPFGMTPPAGNSGGEMGSNPYLGGAGMGFPGAGAKGKGGDTFDDEVPF